MLRKPLQSLLMPLTFLAIVNVAYTFLVVVVLQSWLLTWWIDRRFPFRLVPLWVFCFFSLVVGALSLYYWRKVDRQPKLGCDKFNIFLIYGTMGLFVWILIAISLTHTYYIGDFNVWSVLQAVLSGKDPIPFIEVPRESVDVFPTLGDSLFISYFLSFIFLYIANLRGLRKNVPAQREVIRRSTEDLPTESFFYRRIKRRNNVSFTAGVITA